MDTDTSSKRTRSAAALGAAAAVATILGCGGSTSSDASMSTTSEGAANGGKVTIANFDYAPPTITVSAGSAVEFTNTDSSSHTASADDMTSFDTGTLAKGKSGSVTLAKAGTYTYFCRFHPFMKGTIVVK